jgi:hypothetical protein
VQLPSDHTDCDALGQGRHVNRWKPATAQFWRAEPAAPLALYCLLVAAQLGYIHLTVFGLHQSYGSLRDDIMIVHPWGVLVSSVYLAWRIWLGGGISWTLLVIWGVFRIVRSVSLAWGAAGSPFALGMLPFSAACLVLLFMPAVLDRASKAGRLKLRARRRRGRYGQQVSSPNRY